MNVISKGVPGRNTREALAALETDVMVHKPQHVVLYFGMNDAMNSAKLVPLPDYDATMRAMIRKLSDSGVKTIVLVTLNPVIEAYVKERHPQHPRRADLQNCLAEYDQVIRKMADECHCPLVDLRKIITDNGGTEITPNCLVRCEPNGGGRDGVHLVAAAYEKLGSEVFNALKSRVLPNETIVCFGDSLTFGVHVEGEGKTLGGSYPAVLQRMLNSYDSLV